MAEEVTREYLNQKFEEFGRMIGTGFQDMRKQFTETNDRIDRVYDHVDGFITLNQKLDQEFTMIRAKYERLEQRVARLEGAAV